MSLCDKCFAPGQCCKHLQLRTGDDLVTFWDDEPSAAADFLRQHALPFDVIAMEGHWTDAESGRTYSTARYSCPVLLPNGRCGDYANRPDLCRTFEPGSDPLCVHWRGAESGE